MRPGMTGQASFRLLLPSLYLTGHAVPLLDYRVSGIVEHFFDLRERDLLRIVVDVDGLRPDIDPDLTHTLQCSNRSLDRMLAMLARNVGSYKCRRFHNVYPLFIQVNYLERHPYNPSLQRCSRSKLHGFQDERFYETPCFHYDGRSRLSSGKMEGSSLRISGNRVELDQLLNDFLFAIPFHPRRDTGA